MAGVSTRFASHTSYPLISGISSCMIWALPECSSTASSAYSSAVRPTRVILHDPHHHIHTDQRLLLYCSYALSYCPTTFYSSYYSYNTWPCVHERAECSLSSWTVRISRSCSSMYHYLHHCYHHHHHHLDEVKRVELEENLTVLIESTAALLPSVAAASFP